MFIQPKDLEQCKGTGEKPHPPVFFVRNLHSPFTEQEDGQCPVCVVLNHVVPVMGYQSGNFGSGFKTGKLEVVKP